MPSCSASGSSSSRSARRSSSIISASCRRCARGRERTAAATSLGCRSRSRAASAAISVVAKRLGTSSQSTMRYDARRTSGRRRARSHLLDGPLGGPTLGGQQRDVADGLVAESLVDQVPADQDLAGLGLERVDVQVPGAQPGAVAVELGDAVGVDEDPAPLDGRHEPDDLGRLAARRRQEHDVFDLADGGTVGREQGQAHHPERVHEVAGHAPRLPLDRQRPLTSLTTQGAAATVTSAASSTLAI